jgi:hypothetical protein
MPEITAINAELILISLKGTLSQAIILLVTPLLLLLTLIEYG